MASDKSSLTLVDQLAAKGVDLSALLKEINEKGATDLKPTSSVSAASGKNVAVDKEEEEVATLVKSEDIKGKKTRQPASPPKETPKSKRTKTSKAPVSRKSTRLTKKADVDVEVDDNPDELVMVSSYPIRSIVPELTISKEWLREHQLEEVIVLLEEQKWEELFQSPVEVNVDLVRAFYSSLRVEERQSMTVAYFSVNNEEYMFTSKDLSNWLKVPHTGYAEYAKRVWPASVARKEIQERVGPDALRMGIVNRVLHRILCQNLTPRLQKHEQLLIQDYMLIDKIIQKEQVSLPHQMMHHMSHVMGIPNHGLPYPGTVKRILQHFELYKHENEETASKGFDAENCDRLGFKFSEEEGWTKEGTFEPVGKEVVALSVNNPNLNLWEELAKIHKGVENLTKQFASATKDTSERLSKIENAINLSQVYNRSIKEELASSLDKVMEEVEKASKCSEVFNQKTREAIIELDKHITSVGKQILSELNEVFLTSARCTEGLSAPSNP